MGGVCRSSVRRRTSRRTACTGGACACCEKRKAISTVSSIITEKGVGRQAPEQSRQCSRSDRNLYRKRWVIFAVLKFTAYRQCTTKAILGCPYLQMMIANDRFQIRTGGEETCSGARKHCLRYEYVLVSFITVSIARYQFQKNHAR